MTFEYITSKRTNGCNPFKVFEALKDHKDERLAHFLKRLTYSDFLQTAYWFAVSHKVKADAGGRCQVCNQTSGLSVHHRTYDTHGYEHLNLRDLVALCENCHGLFHGHTTNAPAPIKERRPRGSFAVSATAETLPMPEGDPVVLTLVLIDHCRANGSFTNATLRAFGLKKPLRQGWVHRLVGTEVSREALQAAWDGRLHYNSGPLDRATSPPK